MRRRSLITFVVLNVLISIGVALAVISSLGPSSQGNQQVVITVPILVTATTDPNATQRVVIITATPLPGQQQAVALPTGLLDDSDSTRPPFATLDPELLSQDAALQGTATALPQNCVPHVVKEGDTPYGIALEYGADFQAIMDANGLTEETAAGLQIGDTLVVPLEGCTLTSADVAAAEEDAADEVDLAAAAVEETTEESAAATRTPQPTPRPTLTIPPTATSAQVIIRGVMNPGDVTGEAVEIQNTGATVNIAAWTLSDSEGNIYTFAEQLLFSEARLTVNTRAGRNTPVQLFWGQEAPVWQPGDVVTLTDDDGNVQSTYRIG